MIICNRFCLICALAICFFLIGTIGCTKKQTNTYDIRDECGPIQGSIYHTIADNASCRNKCHGQCAALEMNFFSSLFIDKGIECHLCNCTCLVP